jgi:hypothetical protein
VAVKLIAKIVVLGAVLWSGYWAIAAYGIRSGLAAWFETQRSDAWQADYANITTTGYPLKVTTTLDQPALADPGTGVAWQADNLTLTAPAWWPGHVTVAFPQTAQRLSYLDQSLNLTTTDTTAAMRLKPGSQLEVQDLSLLAGEWGLVQGDGTLFGASDLIVSAQQTERPEEYRMNVSATGFQPGSIPRATMRLPDSWPLVFDTLALDMTVAFDRVWDRTALEQSRPQPRAITLKLLEANWGELRLLATGDVTVDDNGVPTGQVAIKASNWRDMLALAKESGSVSPDIIDATESVVGMLAQLSGNGETLDVKVGLRDGYMLLGPVPIGPAPRLFLR